MDKVSSKKKKNSKDEAKLMVAKAIATLYKYKCEIVPEEEEGGDRVFKAFLNRCLLWDATKLKIDPIDGSFRWLTYDGIDYWSTAAIKHWKKYKKPMGKLVHEHVVPKKALLAMIEKDPTNEKHVHSVLKHYAIAVVVEKREHAKLNKAQKKLEKKDKDWYVKNPWGRYKDAGLELYSTGGKSPSSCKPKPIKLSNL